MTILEKAVSIVTAIGVIGGGVLYLGQPPYANKGWVDTQLAEMDLKSYERERDSLDDRIGDLKVKKAAATNRQVIAEIDNQIDRLQNRLNDIRKIIDGLRSKK